MGCERAHMEMLRGSLCDGCEGWEPVLFKIVVEPIEQVEEPQVFLNGRDPPERQEGFGYQPMRLLWRGGSEPQFEAFRDGGVLIDERGILLEETKDFLPVLGGEECCREER